MRIAIDAFGGDNAPEGIVAGAAEAAKEFADARIILVGDEARIRELLAASGAASLSNVEIRHASEVIAADEEPVRAVRRKKDASMVVAASMVKGGEADALISAGNTGALMTAGLLVVGRLKGIERPALAPMIPTMDGVGVLALDLGANMDATAEQLAQYAVMGSVYRSKVHGIKEPRVGLLNVGTEPGKGNEVTKAAYPLLEAAPIRFVGNVEARDILNGVCDVLVCDGFVGNVMLKSLEGTAQTLFGALKQEFTRTTLSKLAAAVLRPGLRKFRDKMDYREVGAAPMLGLTGVVMKSHGSSDARAIKNAVRQTVSALRSDVVGTIASELGKGE
ncbi:phosphate acyltransferase PlsX [Paenibacillus sp.]|uniref:phosphate acyltransferase PlsX n=1 Tax=Paenibacillus sp. TaxID=58172 RepID=UPI002D71E369|nr:phosphate acyltransferase PlsX [Paenibacillus sp.]HZG84440.1 phosphate acyltransferase PlsX [Paenibacillus sp.]